MTVIRYGKSSDGLLEIKAGFTSDNDKLRDDLLQLATAYLKQPRRLLCKICETTLPADADFTKHGIGYSFCTTCGQLNGQHEDSDEFAQLVYAEQGADSYVQTYTSENRTAYKNRVKRIYQPKADFLNEVLVADGANTPRCADLGAGSGYFVSALLNSGVDALGYEVGKGQVDLADAMIGKGRVRHILLDQITDLAGSVDAEVISMIGVLEHLQKPRAVLDAIKRNPSVRYLFISVPLFSACVVLESIFPKVMPRHLAGDHTHLFTESSLDWICRTYGFERIGEWWFGMDMMDLFRDVTVTLDSPNMTERWSNSFLPALDAMQSALDERKLSSEVHMVLKL